MRLISTLVSMGVLASFSTQYLFAEPRFVGYSHDSSPNVMYFIGYYDRATDSFSKTEYKNKDKQISVDPLKLVKNTFDVYCHDRKVGTAEVTSYVPEVGPEWEIGLTPKNLVCKPGRLILSPDKTDEEIKTKSAIADIQSLDENSTASRWAEREFKSMNQQKLNSSSGLTIHTWKINVGKSEPTLFASCVKPDLKDPSDDPLDQTFFFLPGFWPV